MLFTMEDEERMMRTHWESVDREAAGKVGSKAILMVAGKAWSRL